MKILVKQLQGGECSLEVLPTMQILEIKRQVEEKLKIPREEQTLLLLGRTLVDQNTVADYPTIKDGTKLNLVVKKPDGLYEASVKYFKKMDMTDAEARATAVRFLKIVQEKFDRMSWDDIERFSMDCLLEESGQRCPPMEPENDDNYGL